MGVSKCILFEKEERLGDESNLLTEIQTLFFSRAYESPFAVCIFLSAITKSLKVFVSPSSFVSLAEITVGATKSSSFFVRIFTSISTSLISLLTSLMPVPNSFMLVTICFNSSFMLSSSLFHWWRSSLYRDPYSKLRKSQQSPSNRTGNIWITALVWLVWVVF